MRTLSSDAYLVGLTHVLTGATTPAMRAKQFRDSTDRRKGSKGPHLKNYPTNHKSI